MIKIAIIDLLGLTYDGDTLNSRGLGGSESAVILMSKELAKIGFNVTVFNNCLDSQATPGIYDNVKFIDHTQADTNEVFDIVISSRSVYPFFANNQYGTMCANATHKVVWMHDTFCEGDQHIEDMINQGIIDELFTLSDFHSTYVLNCDHGSKRNFEVLKHKIFQTRNGAVKYIDEINLSKKDKNHFVYNASVTKGLKPLLNDIWPKVKEQIPNAHLTVIGGYYRFREGAEPDAQEKDLHAFEESISKDLNVTFTNVIPQSQIADILANATYMIYPTDFPETFGISSLESLLYKTPIITSRFGALEETAIDLACYKTNYASVPNSLFPHIDAQAQSDIFVSKVLEAYGDDYLLQQKQNYCDVINDIYGWDTVALQWKQQFYFKLEKYLPVDDYRKVQQINDKVKRVYGRRFDNEVERQVYKSYGDQKRIVIISPFWNASDYLLAHCESIDQQDYDNYLHILIDDASDDVIPELPENKKRIFVQNPQRLGCIRNQMNAFHRWVEEDDIVILLDGDDFLVSNNTIFHYYNQLYNDGIEFTYGSCWSMADGIPLIAQDYPTDVKLNKTYREHLFNWKIPYTHLRTFKGIHCKDLNYSNYKKDGKWLMSGMDNPLFYELIEKVDSDKIKAVKEITCFYNDINPLNDYKVNPMEQNQNADTSYETSEEKHAPHLLYKKIEELPEINILIAVPTNKYISPETFKSIYDVKKPQNVKLHFEYFFGYMVDQVRNLAVEWGKNYDYLWFIDSDISFDEGALIRLLSHDKDIVSGVYVQRKEPHNITELYHDTGKGQENIIWTEELKNKVFRVSACGMGCVLIKRHVLKTIEYPHFYYQSAINHMNTISEDVYFCNKAKKLNWQIWADGGVICHHHGESVFIPTDEEKK